MLNFENCDRALFPGVGPYEIPIISGERDIRIDKLEWIPFNFARTATNRAGKGIHFYIDDYRFIRLWNRPDDYISLLQEFGAVCAPDFSQYTDMPTAMRIYNHYRKHWLAAYWQAHGIRVIPTICWSTPDSFDYCLDGEPRQSIVSISSVGSRYCMDAFNASYRKAIKALQPTQILWYGKVPEEFDWNVVRVSPYYKKIEEERIAKHGRTRGIQRGKQ